MLNGYPPEYALDIGGIAAYYLKGFFNYPSGACKGFLPLLLPDRHVIY